MSEYNILYHWAQREPVERQASHLHNTTTGTVADYLRRLPPKSYATTPEEFIMLGLGVRDDVDNLILSVSRYPFRGLWIEMHHFRFGVSLPTLPPHRCVARLERLRYATAVTNGAAEATAAILSYLDPAQPKPPCVPWA